MAVSYTHLDVYKRQMIGAAGYVAYKHGVRASYDCSADPGLELENVEEASV